MKFLYAFGLVVSSYAFYKYKQKSTKLLMVHSNNRLSRLFHLINVKFFENLKPSLIFFFSGHAQTFLLELLTIVIRFFKKVFRFYNFKYRREIFELNDGCKLAIDHAVKKENRNKALIKEGVGNIRGNIHVYDKILIVVPGVTSTSADYYVKSIVEDFSEEFDCRVIHARGFGGMKLRSPLMISSACFKDLQEYIEKVCMENRDKKVFAVGFSFGGMMLARYLGESGDKVPSNFLAASGLCYPCCLKETKNYAEVHFNGLYSKASLSNVKATFYANLEILFNEKFHKGRTENIIAEKEKIMKEIEQCVLLSDFDRVWTTRVLGFNHVEDYYIYSKLDNYLSNIKVPFLSIFAEDDPIIPISSVPFKTLQSNPNTVTVVTQYGGHLGFFGGTLLPQRVLDQPIRSFLKTVEILKDTETVCK